MTRYLRIGVLALVLLAACGSDDGGTVSNDTTTTREAGTGDKGVKATLKEFSIALSPASTAAGEVLFNLNNVGAIEHEFVVFKTNLAPDKLPVDADGNVDEEGAGVTHIDENEHVLPKTPTDLKVTLDAGNYVVVCNLPTHYKAGMHTKLVVS